MPNWEHGLGGKKIMNDKCKKRNKKGMGRKKMSELTPKERADRILKHASWEDAEDAGVEILARCMAFRVFVKGDKECIVRVVGRICDRADEWAKNEGTFYLAAARVGNKLREKKKDDGHVSYVERCEKDEKMSTGDEEVSEGEPQST